MAISLAFGVLFATMITLLLVPSLYMIVEDVKHRSIPWFSTVLGYIKHRVVVSLKG